MIQQLDRYRTTADWHPGAPLLAPITLGDRVCLSQGAYLCTGNHDFRSPGFDLRLGPITIGTGAIVRGNPAVVVGQR